MLEQMCGRIAAKIYNPERHEDEEMIAFGLEVIISTISNVLAITLIAFVLGYGMEMLVFFLAFGVLRLSAGGWHAKNHLICFASYFTVSFVAIHLVKLIPSHYYIISLVVFLVASMILIYTYAPTETPNRPIFPKERVKFRKRSIRLVFLLAALICLIAASGVWSIALVASAAVLVESLSLIQLKKLKLWRKRDEKIKRVLCKEVRDF